MSSMGIETNKQTLCQIFLYHIAYLTVFVIIYHCNTSYVAIRQHIDTFGRI